jgi:hypothetical protein
MKLPNQPDHRALAKALELRVLDGPGIIDAALRRAAADRAAGGPPMAAPYDDIARQIGESSYQVTDVQVTNTVAATGSEAAAFELIMAATLGAGLWRWRVGIKVLEEATHETS